MHPWINFCILSTKLIWYTTIACRWNYATEKELDGSSHWGQLSSYGGGGYIQELGSNKADSLEIIAQLKNNLWLDRGTRAVFTDFSVYNANINLFCIIR